MKTKLSTFRFEPSSRNRDEDALRGAGHRVGVTRVFNWLAGGLVSAVKFPNLWAVVDATCVVLAVLFKALPMMRPLAMIVAPLMIGAIMFAHDRIRSGRPVHLADVLRALLKHRNALFSIGLLSCTVVMIGYMLIITVMHASLMASMMTLGMHNVSITYGNDTGFMGLFESAVVVPVFAVAMAATWFAPALVMMRGLSPFDAMVTSLNAAARNWPVLLIYILAVAGTVAAARVVPLLVTLPVIALVLLLSIYQGYVEIFAGSGRDVSCKS
jgi:hypothetical protein